MREVTGEVASGEWRVTSGEILKAQEPLPAGQKKTAGETLNRLLNFSMGIC